LRHTSDTTPSMSSAGTYSTAATTLAGRARQLRLVTDPSSATAPSVTQRAPSSAEDSGQSLWGGAGIHGSRSESRASRPRVPPPASDVTAVHSIVEGGC